MGLFNRKKEKRSKTSIKDPWLWPSLSGFFNSVFKGDAATSEWQAIQLSSVYACIRLISNTIAMLPLNLYVKEGSSARIVDNSLNKVLYRCSNERTTAFVFRQTMQSHVLLFGNGYAEIVKNNRGEIIGLNVLAAWNMKVEKNDRNEIIYEYTDDQRTIVFREEEILHIPGLSFDGLIGYSPLAVMRNEVGLGLSLQKFGSKYFSNGTNMGGFLEHPDKLGKTSADRLKSDFDSNFSGVENACKTIVLEEGMKYNKIAIPADEAQFIQSRQFQLEEICRYYGVQLHMIQHLDRATFNNIEQQGIEFKTYCIGPWAATWEQEIYKSLLTEEEQNAGYYAKFNFNSLLRADYQSRMEGYRIGIQMGLFSLNDVRKMEDINPIKGEGGDTHWVNAAMIPINVQLTQPVETNVQSQTNEGGENNGKGKEGDEDD